MIGDQNKDEMKAKIFKALANPSRLKIIEALSTGKKNVGELTIELHMEQSLVSHNLKLLKDCESYPLKTARTGPIPSGTKESRRFWAPQI